jgi:hypothetical protein
VEGTFRGALIGSCHRAVDLWEQDFLRMWICLFDCLIVFMSEVFDRQINRFLSMGGMLFLGYWRPVRRHHIGHYFLCLEGTIQTIQPIGQVEYVPITSGKYR